MRWRRWAALKGTRGSGISLCRISIVLSSFEEGRLLVHCDVFLFFPWQCPSRCGTKAPRAILKKKLNLQHIPHSISGSPAVASLVESRPGFLEETGSAQIKRINLMAMVMVVGGSSKKTGVSRSLSHPSKWRQGALMWVLMAHWECAVGVVC